MNAIDAARRHPVITIDAGQTIAQAAQSMERHGIGALLVLDGSRLTGIVTDRDIVVRGVARLYPTDARIDSVMSSGVVALAADADLRDALAAFSRHGIRRLPLVDGVELVGILTLDDLIIDAAHQLGDIVAPIVEQVVHGRPVPRLPATAT